MKKKHDICVKVFDLQETIYTDQTGQFPYLSSKGNRYIMVAYHIDANYIAMEPIKNRTEAQMIAIYQRIIDRWKAAGLTMKKQILDNEASEEYKNGMEYELVPPHDRQRNIAEQIIQTAKKPLREHHVRSARNISDALVVQARSTS